MQRPEVVKVYEEDPLVLKETNLKLLGEAFVKGPKWLAENGDFVITDTRNSLDEIKILPPVIPSKAVCIGLNYHDHIEETNSKVPENPVVFIKPSTTVIGHMDDIKYPKLSKRVDYEGELAVVIGKKGKDISVSDAKEYIFGYTCGNDVTARDLQTADGQWTISKSFDTFYLSDHV